MSKSIGKCTLAISSASDPAWTSSNHNPASFSVDMTNTMKLNRVVRVAPSQVVIPRLFPNISEHNNVLVFYGRRVIEEPTYLPAPRDWIRTVSPQWTERYRIVIPEGIYNIDQILTLINATVTPLGQTWSFNTITMSIEITTTAPGAQTVVYGYFTPAPVAPIDEWFPLMYVTGGQSDLFNTLGLEAAAFSTSVGFTDNVTFDRTNPNTFDATRGTTIDNIPALALFDREKHSYDYWLNNDYDTPPLNRPNLAGPEFVHVLISELGDSSTINATTGVLYDVVKSVEMTQAPYGERVATTITDLETDAINFQHFRSVNGFRVRIVDSKFRALKLPRNSEVNITLGIWYQQD